MADWREKLVELEEKVNGMSRRERLIMLLMVVALQVSGWLEFYQKPADAELKKLHKRQTEYETRIGEMLTMQEEILSRAQQDPNRKNQEYQQRLQAEIKRLEASLETATKNLIAPEEMPRALEQLLAPFDGLRLVKMELQGPKPLATETLEAMGQGADGMPAGGAATDEFFNQEGAGANNGMPAAGAVSGGGRVIYQHPLTISLEGEYLSILNYLKAMEAAPWMIYWDHFELDTVQYPLARVTLTVYTLNLSRAWLGT